MNKKGFTLIELLVVIAVISLISSILYSSVSSARTKASNTRNVQQTRELGKAVNQYNVSSSSPLIPSTGSDSLACLSQQCTIDGVVGTVDPTLANELSEYIPQIPENNSSITVDGSEYSGIIYIHDSASDSGYIYYIQEDSPTCPVGYESVPAGSSTICGINPEDGSDTPVVIDDGYDYAVTEVSISNDINEGGPQGEGYVTVGLSSVNTTGDYITCTLGYYNQGTGSTYDIIIDESDSLAGYGGIYVQIDNGYQYGYAYLTAVDDTEVEGTEYIYLENFYCTQPEVNTSAFTNSDFTITIHDND